MRVSPLESVVNEPTQHPKPIQAARRKLVRGAFAVPAVITLTSGAPAAATSLTCFQKQFDPVKGGPVLPSDGVGAGYDFVRIPFYKRHSNNAMFIKGSDLEAIRNMSGGVVSSSLAGPSAWQRINDGVVGNIITWDPVLQSTPSGHLVVRFDVNGNILGIGKGTSGSAIYGSCWVSAYPSH
jgi:hypothetical protein